MKSLASALGKEETVKKLDRHFDENDGYWPAKDTVDKIVQSSQRAKKLTDQQFCLFQYSLLGRIFLKGAASTGKSFHFDDAGIVLVPSIQRRETGTDSFALHLSLRGIYQESIRGIPKMGAD